MLTGRAPFHIRITVTILSQGICNVGNVHFRSRYRLAYSTSKGRTAPSRQRAAAPRERGVFITLLCCIYDEGGPIKRDDDRLAEVFRGEYVHHAAAIEKIFAAYKALHSERDGFASGLYASPYKSESTLQSVAELTGLRDFDKAFLPGFGAQVWPANTPRRAVIGGDVAQSLNESMG